MKNKKRNTSESRSGKYADKNYPLVDSLHSYSSEKNPKREEKKQMSVLKEPNQTYSISSKMRSIGNSKGVILPNRVIEEAGISPDADLIILVSNGVIQIAEVKSPDSVNTDLSSWDAHFKTAIKMGYKPEADIWNAMQNRFDMEEWT